MTIYIEYVIVDNFIMSYLILKVTSCLTRITISNVKLVFTCLTFALYVVFVPFVRLGIQKLTLLNLLVSILICCTLISVYNFRKKVIPFYITFISISFIVYALCNVIVCVLGGDFSTICYSLDFPISVIFLSIYLYFKILLSYFNKIKKSYDLQELIYDANIIYKNKCVKLSALLDTGNMLIDSETNLPIAVIPFNCLNKLLSQNELLCLFMKKKCDTIPNLHYINYGTAGKSKIKMPVFKIDSLELRKKDFEVKRQCMVGVTFNVITHNYCFDMLIGLKMLSN